MKALLRSIAVKITFITLIAGFLTAEKGYAQIPSTGGSYTIDSTLGNTFSGGATGNFKSFKRAIAALNTTTQGTITTGVTFQVTAGQTFYENETAGLILTYQNVNGPQIKFIKNGAGADPNIYGTNGTGVSDAVLTLNGASNYTFDGIDFTDAPSNSGSNAEMEEGVLFGAFFPNTNTGNNNYNTFQNCTITLNNANTNSSVRGYGVVFTNNNGNNTSSNNYNTLTHNTVKNCAYGGIILWGNNTYNDAGNIISYNTITNIGANSGSNSYGAVNVGYQIGASIFNNTINNTNSYNVALGIGGANYGNASVTVYGNTISSMTSTSGAAYGIQMAATYTNIYNNRINLISGTSTTAGISMGATNFDIHDNLITNLSGGNVYGVYDNNSGSDPTTGINRIYKDTIANLSGGSSNTAGIYMSTTVGIVSIHDDTLYNIQGSSSTAVSGIYQIHAGSATPIGDTIYNNTMNTITSSSAPAYGIYTNINSANIFYGNKIRKITGPNVCAAIYYNTGSSEYCYNNLVDVVTSSNNASYGLALYAGTPSAVYGNTLNHVTISGGTNAGNADGILISGTGSVSSLSVYGNNISNLTTASVSTSAHYVYGISITSANVSIGNIFNNTISATGCTSTGATNCNVYGINVSNAASSSIYNVYSNNLSSLTSSSTYTSIFTIGAIWMSAGNISTCNLYSNNIGTINATSTAANGPADLYGVYISSAGGSSAFNVYNNSISGITTPSTSTSTTRNIAGIYVSTTSIGSGFYYGNNINTVSSTGASGQANVYGMYITGASSLISAFNNTIQNVSTKSTSQALVGLDITGGTEAIARVYNNTINTVQAFTTTYTGTSTGLLLSDAAATTNSSCHDNTVTNISTGSTTSGGNLTGMSIQGSSAAIIDSVYNNLVSNIISSRISAQGTTNGLQVGVTGTNYVFNNVVHDIKDTASTTSTGNVIGINASSGHGNYVFKNMVYSVRNTTSSTVGGLTCGLSVARSGSTNVPEYIFNNMIWDIENYQAGYNLYPTTVGLGVPGGNDENFVNYFVYYNTVYLDGATSGGNSVMTAACSVGTFDDSCHVDLRDNIFVNNITIGSTGPLSVAAALLNVRQYSDTTVTFAGMSDYNLVYAGTPGPQHLLYMVDTLINGGNNGSIADTAQSLSHYRSIMGSLYRGVEQHSITGLPTFVNTATKPYDLHLNTTSCVYSGPGSNAGEPITSPIAVNDDIDGNTRAGSPGYTGGDPAPDMGADEAGGAYHPGPITGTSNVCTGQSGVVYSAASVTGASGYSWILPTGASIATGSGTNSITVNFSGSAVSGNVEVSPTGCSAKSDTSYFAVTVNSIGAAGTISGTTPVCQGTTNIYSVVAITNATSYNWTLPAGAIIVGASNNNSIAINFSPSSTGGNITVNGANTCSSGTASSPFVVTVNAAPGSAGTIAGSATSICQGTSGVTFSVPTITGATTYNWSLPTGATISGATSNSISVNFSTSASAGAQTITVNGSSGCGTGATSDGYAILVNPLPGAAGSISGPATPSVCQGGTLGVFSIPAITNATSYSWTLPSGAAISGSTNNGQYITVSFSNTAATGAQNIMVAGLSCGTGVASAPFAIAVSAPPTIFTVSGSSPCGAVVVNQSGSTNGISYQLYLNGVATGSPVNGTGNPINFGSQSAAGTYTVVGTSAGGCSANMNGSATVNPTPVGGIVTTPYVIICSGNTTTLTVTGSVGSNLQWQISSDNTTWSDITGATNTTYTTASGDGNGNKFYRMLSKSTACWDVASTTAEVDVSNPIIIVTATNVTDNSLTLNWSPTGTGNYSISYSGPSSATLTSVTPAKTITGLTANGTYSITVTQTGASLSGCPASGTVTGVITLCAMPTGVTLSSPAPAQIQVSWTGVPGTDYRVYYRPLFSYNTYFTKDVSNASSVLLTKQGNNNLYASTTYEVYVSTLDCPVTGAVGQPTSPTNVTTLPTVACATPVIDSVRSLCPVQIEVFIHDNGVNQYNVFIQRITPSILAVNSYGVSGTYFTINTPYSGDQYLIAVEAKCGSALSSIYVWPDNVTIKPLCTSPNNLVLSNPTCHGFTASWNADQCLSNSASGYDLYLRVAGTINYNSYGVSLPSAGIGPNKLVNWLTTGRTYQVFVRSVYDCNGFVTYGPTSQVETITTLSSGCRDEEQTNEPQENKPATQQYSPDNSEVFSLYPNPNGGKFVVDLSRLNIEEDAVRIEVFNMMGQTVITHLTTISGGRMSEYINLPGGTAAGTYIVRLTAGKNVYTAKINVSK